LTASLIAVRFLVASNTLRVSSRREHNTRAPIIYTKTRCDLRHALFPRIAISLSSFVEQKSFYALLRCTTRRTQDDVIFPFLSQEIRKDFIPKGSPFVPKKPKI